MPQEGAVIRRRGVPEESGLWCLARIMGVMEVSWLEIFGFLIPS